jgi:hypothetical protein
MMVNRIVGGLVVVGALLAGPVQPVFAQQTVNLSLGGFVVRGEDARVDDDWLNENRTYLTFDIKDFNGPTVGVEWLVPVGEFFEAGAGVAFSRRTVPSVYTDYVDSDGTEIEQDLRLRIVPVAFTLRVLPLGQSFGVQPYLGVGVGIFAWRYSESGEFIDFTQGQTIFREQYAASGNELGPIALGGVRFASDTFSVGGEVRYQSAADDLGETFATGTFEPRIDLGGWSYLLNVGIRFGR